MKRLVLLMIASVSVLVFTNMGCDRDCLLTYIENNSSHPVGFLVTMERAAPRTAHPDSLPESYHIYNILNPRTREGVWIGDVSLKRHFKTEQWTTVFIFHKDTLDKYPWAEIRDDYKILARYNITYEDLMQCGQVLTYPPDPSMQGIKMYPPYEDLAGSE